MTLKLGLRITRQYGNFYEGPADDLVFGTLDADKSILVVFDHARTLDDRNYAFIQSAVLYTTITGERRVRVCNVALQVVSLAGNVFRYADMDTVVTLMAREGLFSVHSTSGPCLLLMIPVAVSKLSNQKISYIHEELTEKSASILLGYRKHCAAATAPSQVQLTTYNLLSA